jgi:ribose transport system ATP-binding protein
MSAGRQPLLRVRGIVKEFPGVRALDGVDLDVDPGEVHCLLGQNGAGKSTLIKVLSGAHQPDSGEIRWRGERIRIADPTAALARGIATIYQELDLLPDMTVAENVFLGHERSGAGITRRRAMRAEAGRLLARLGHPEITPAMEVRRLSPAGQQLVSIARALSYEVRLVIMDEPSAALTADEVANLFRVIRELAAADVAVVYISHRLDEIRDIGDRVTVLKDGRTVAGGLPAKTTPTAAVVRLMTGRSVEFPFPPRPGVAEGRAELLRVERLSRAGEFKDVSFTVHEGEIVGLAGLVGAGRSEVLAAIFGATRPDSGEVRFRGGPLKPGDTAASVRAGIGFAPEERKRQALLLDEPVYRNVSLASLRRFARLGFLDVSREVRAASRVTASLEVRPADPRRVMRNLSGGNQQKAVVGRWLLRDCRLLLLDEPTRGVDVGARTELYGLVRRLADSGVGVLLVSSEVPEVLGLADRVVVLREGRVVHEGPAVELDEARVLDLVMEGSAA